jgi:hypothetical protein
VKRRESNGRNGLFEKASPGESADGTGGSHAPVRDDRSL